MTAESAAGTATSPRTAPRVVVAAAALDVALVLLFAGVGRGSHARDATVLGLFETAWPFLAGLAASWLLCAAWRRPFAPLRTGIPLWIGSVAIGMLLRLVAGSGTALAFVLVAAGTLAVLLVGWRGIAALVRRARTRR
ncbi:DUF3054 domain-containing protein [Leucobacter zeae]|nr:DUF3054 domain-containing protein [Leucobacter zeae]